MDRHREGAGRVNKYTYIPSYRPMSIETEQSRVCIEIFFFLVGF